jgi:hypothetical protein
LSRIAPVDALTLGSIEPVYAAVVTSATTQTITIVPRMVCLLLFESAFADSIPKQFPINEKYVGAFEVQRLAHYRQEQYVGRGFSPDTLEIQFSRKASGLKPIGAKLRHA